ncbi:hypothetical protein D7D52_32065 [Nocardia yunnanensis]|uniref:Uncharacterized protein n=1 Tax=Nocardia yunnanensis TaxID=2382165 RepID=A0A386ZK78_9NOCA|nr:hypothetical protein [Nocardia yunnanensis]AYF77683.1 hypothetical protein D7D52_32065 [Nocardia yunnanensis]
MVRRSPQEKKALSYAKDRRNDFGENDKASRKNIPRTKRILNRTDRHHDRSELAAATGRIAPNVAEQTETALRGKRSKWSTTRWRKHPDIPLGEVVRRKLQHRTAPTPDH